MNIHNPTPLRHHVLQPLLLLLLLFAAIPTWAQDKPTVEEFIDDTSDPTASELYYKVKDNSGISPGLIKVLINAEVESFDGLMVEDEEGKKWFKKNPGEYWVLMAAYDEKNKELGAPLLKVNFKDDFQPLEVVFEKYDNIKIEPLHTYVLKINVPEKGYDYSNEKIVHIKITPPNAELKLAGRVEKLRDGKGSVELAQGKHPWQVTATGYHSQNGDIVIKEGKKTDSLIVNLRPRMGKLRIRTNAEAANVSVDGIKYERITSEPVEIKVGQRKVKVEAKGYKTEERIVEIFENETSTEPFNLVDLNTYKFTSSPSGAAIIVDGESIGTTGGSQPCTKDLTTGEYRIQATKAGYLNFDEKMKLSSDNPNVHVKLLKIYNYKNEFYAEGNFKAGSFMGYGATIGGYFQNVNAEVSYLMGSGKSETIYWSGNNTPPIACTYSPSTNITLKLGYGIPLSNRYRITPQAGVGLVKLKETIEEGGNTTPADGANTTMGLVGVRFSAAIANHFAASISPEFGFSMSKSKGYEALSEVSSDVKKWGEGFNVKLGLTVFF